MEKDIKWFLEYKKNENLKKIKSYDIIGEYPFFCRNNIFSIELIKLLDWTIKPNIKPEKKNKKKNM